MKKLLILSAALLLTGCASTGVVQVGKDRYMSFNRTSFQQQLKHQQGATTNEEETISFNRTSFQQQLKHQT